MSLPYPPPFQDLATLAQHVCLGESTIEIMVKEGRFPAPCYRGGKRLWRWSAVEKFLDKPEPVAVLSITEATRRADNHG